MDLLLAILIAVRSLLASDPQTASAYSEDEKLAISRHILDNNLYKVDDNGVVIDPDVSL